MIRAKRASLLVEIRLEARATRRTAYQRIPFIGPGRPLIGSSWGVSPPVNNRQQNCSAINRHLCTKDIPGIIQILPADAAHKHPVGYQIPGASLAETHASSGA